MVLTTGFCSRTAARSTNGSRNDSRVCMFDHPSRCRVVVLGNQARNLLQSGATFAHTGRCPQGPLTYALAVVQASQDAIRLL